MLTERERGLAARLDRVIAALALGAALAVAGGCWLAFGVTIPDGPPPTAPRAFHP